MVRPNFHTPLVLAEQYSPETGDTKLSPLAKGPIPDGDVFKWVAVWIYQQPGEGPGAAAAGQSGYDQEITTKWEVDTFRVKGSDDFAPGQPATAMALALIWPEGNEDKREFYWWMESVLISDGSA